MKKPKKKIFAAITGASGGIGRSIIKNLIKKYNLVIFTRKLNKDFKDFLQIQKRKNGSILKIIKADFNELDQLKVKIERELKNVNNIEVLINNAGTLHNSSFFSTSYKQVVNHMNINFISHFLITQFISKKMIKNKKGKILNIISNSIIINPKGRIAYNSSKSALDSFTKTLAQELAPFNITVNSISPGLTNTKMMKNNTPKNYIDKIKQKLPRKKFAKPDDISKFIMFLIDQKSSFMTGENIVIDGGAS